MPDKNKDENKTVTEMFAFIADSDRGEGLMGIMTQGGWMPLVGADIRRIDSLYPAAVEMAKLAGCKFKILKFSTREDITEDVVKRNPIKEKSRIIMPGNQ